MPELDNEKQELHPKLPDLVSIMAEVLGDVKAGRTAAQAIVEGQRAKATKGDTKAAEWLFKHGYGSPRTATHTGDTAPLQAIAEGQQTSDPLHSHITKATASITYSREGRIVHVAGKTSRLRHRQEAFIVALEKSFGNVSQAATLTNIDRDRHYDWLKKYPEYKVAVSNILPFTHDFVESKILERIASGSDSMIQWYADRQMKHRGYGRPMDIEDGGKIEEQVIIEEQLTEEAEAEDVTDQPDASSQENTQL